MLLVKSTVNGLIYYAENPKQKHVEVSIYFERGCIYKTISELENNEQGNKYKIEREISKTDFLLYHTNHIGGGKFTKAELCGSATSHVFKRDFIEM